MKRLLLALLTLALIASSNRGEAQIFTDGQVILPQVHYVLMTDAVEPFEIPASPRLDLAEDEGTIEFWVQPSWPGSGGAAYRCVVANGRPVYRRAASDSSRFETFFEARYAVYLTRQEIVFQSGAELHEVSFTDFASGSPFSKASPTHFSIATEGNQTTIYADGRSAVTIPVGYGPSGGATVTVGDLPHSARGTILKRKNNKEFDELQADDSNDFGAFTGSLGGVRIWSTRVDHSALISTDTSDNPEPASIRLYGQLHAERDLAFEAAVPGRRYDVRRGDLVTFSRFDHPLGARMVLADPIGGNWINSSLREPRLGRTPPDLKEFEPITVIEEHKVITMLPTEGSGSPPSHYSVFVNGDLSGTLVRREVSGEHSLDYVALDGSTMPVASAENRDKLTFFGLAAELGPANGGEIELIRDTARSKGTAAPASDVFLAGMRVSDINFSLKSYNILELHPFDFWRGGKKFTGSNQWIFDKGHSDEWQLAFGSNDVLPLGFQMDSHGESSGRTRATTVTTERELYHAVRAKFGIQGGPPKIKSKGMNAELQESESFQTAATSVTNLGCSWAKWGTVLLDPLFIRLSRDFRDDVESLRLDRNFGTFIGKWGTHYPVGVSHGVMLHTQRSLDESSVTQTSEWGIDVGGFYQVGESQDPAFKVEASAGTTNREQARDMLSLEKAEWDAVGFSMVSGNPEMLVANAENAQAVPISMDLRLIHELLSPTYFEDPKVFTTLRYELRDELLRYLQGDRDPSPLPAVEVPPLYDSVTFFVEIDRFRHDAEDGDGSEAEFWGKIRASAYSNGADNQILDSGGLAPETTVVWETGKGSEYKIRDYEEVSWSDFASAKGSREAYEAAKGKHSYLVAPTRLAFKVDVQEVLLEEFQVRLAFDLTEEDTGWDADEIFHGGQLHLGEAHFRGADGLFANAEYPLKRVVRVVEKDKDGWIEFEVKVWTEIGSHPWKNPSAKAQKALESALREGVPRTRSRGAAELVEARGLDSEDVLAYFPMDQDGLRKPGARWWNGDKRVGGIDPANHTVMLDFRPGDEEFAVGLVPTEAYREVEGARAVLLLRGDFYYTEADAEDRDRLDLWIGQVDAGHSLTKDTKITSEELDRLRIGFGDEHINTIWREDATLHLQTRLFEDIATLDPEAWYTIGLSFGPALDDQDEGADPPAGSTQQLTWVLYERDPLRVIAKGTERLIDAAPGPHVSKFTTSRLRYDGNPEQRAQLDEVYVFDHALTADQVDAVAGAARTPAPAVVLPHAYWPFDSQRQAAPGMLPFQGSLGRITDDALLLQPMADTLTPPPLDLRDFTLAFDVRTTDSTRRVILEDEHGLFEISLFENADMQGLHVKMGEGGAAWFLPDEISLAPNTGAKIQNYESTPYAWQRVMVSFDGLEVTLAVDDGSGWVRKQSGIINSLIRDRFAALMRTHASREITWSIRAEYHHPGTKLAAVEGHQPEAASELAMVDEVRFWQGAMRPDAMNRAMITPRRFEPPSQLTRLHGYYPLGRPEGLERSQDGDLLEQLVDPLLRDAFFMPVADITLEQVVDRALAPLVDEPVRLRTDDMAISDSTVHLDFFLGEQSLSLRSGPVRFSCVGGRPELRIETGDEHALVYDPAYGDRIATGAWHKLVLGINAWEASLWVFLDGETLGRIPLTAPVVEALRAADADPASWRIEVEQPGPAITSERTLVDELILLTPCLGSFDLEELAARQREAGGDAPPSRLRLAEGLAALDPEISRLRVEDESIADDLVAYYPFDGDLGEHSGRFGQPLTPSGSGATAGTDAGALDSREDLISMLPGLDLEQYTIGAWVSPRTPGSTLLTAPGLSLRVGLAVPELRQRLEEAFRVDDLEDVEAFDIDEMLENPELGIAKIREILSADADAMDQLFDRQLLASCVQFMIVFRGLHSLELELESIDGRKMTSSLGYLLEPKAEFFLSMAEDEYLPGLTERFSGYGPGTWVNLVLTVDVTAGKIRGMMNGRRIQPIQLPRDFRLRSSDGSASREVGVVATSGFPVDALVDELLVLNGAPLVTSGAYEYLSTRPRQEGPPVVWTVEEGYLRPDTVYTLRNAEVVSVSGGGHQGVGQWDNIQGMVRAVPGLSNHFTMIGPYDYNADLSWRVSHDDGGPRIAMEKGDPAIWEVQDLGEGGPFAFRYRSGGAWEGWYLSIIPLPSDPWKFRATLVPDTPFPWKASH